MSSIYLPTLLTALAVSACQTPAAQVRQSADWTRTIDLREVATLNPESFQAQSLLFLRGVHAQRQALLDLLRLRYPHQVLSGAGACEACKSLAVVSRWPIREHKTVRVFLKGRWMLGLHVVVEGPDGPFQTLVLDAKAGAESSHDPSIRGRVSAMPWRMPTVLPDCEEFGNLAKSGGMWFPAGLPEDERPVFASYL